MFELLHPCCGENANDGGNSKQQRGKIKGGKKIDKLVISIGNSLRTDDGIAHLIVDNLSGKVEDCDFIKATQLLPEHIDIIIKYKKTIIIDAEINKYYGLVKLKKLHKEDKIPFYASHNIDFFDILSLLNKQKNEVDIFLLTITVENLGFMDHISEKLYNYMSIINKQVFEIVSNV
ncbi:MULTISPECIES: hydrogenase maturation protease [Calditerrivibrio]|uniref:Hydrogenase maturation protease n=1 Tax=Calditerrivibrio nitroreducens TaxID=477976 RepID=A0A2J6WP20_9BACT|nr:MAG: hypothetical protein C0187_02345 [Calditerrivibrio nitroreducens]